MSVFNRPAWAQPRASEAGEEDEDEELNIFSHSSRSYHDIIAEQERHRREKAERKKISRDAGGSASKKGDGQPGPSKRRRITAEDGEALLNGFELSSPVEVPEGGKGDDEEEEDELYMNGNTPMRPMKRSPSKIKGSGGEESARTSRMLRRDEENVRLAVEKEKEKEGVRNGDVGEKDEESDDDVKITGVVALSRTGNGADGDSDDEFAELARRARQQRRQKEQRARESETAAQSASPEKRAERTRQQQDDADPQPDPVIQLLITSDIPDSSPLVVHRKLSQRLQEVRRVWCAKQGFPPAFSDKVFLVHRMRRVYDVTTCRSLGLEVDAFGHVTMAGAEDSEGVERVHLIAVTEPLFADMKAEREREALRRSRVLSPNAEDEDEVAEAAGNADADGETSLIRLLLKAKDREDLRLRVRPSTTFSRIVRTYDRLYSLKGQPIFLEFDGERLQPEDEVQNTEITDLDCIDVHFG